MVGVFPQSETGINLALTLFENDNWNPKDIDFEGYLEFHVYYVPFKQKEGTPEGKPEYTATYEEIG